jgi:hypothetical protein
MNFSDREIKLPQRDKPHSFFFVLNAEMPQAREKISPLASSKTPSEINGVR